MLEYDMLSCQQTHPRIVSPRRRFIGNLLSCCMFAQYVANRIYYNTVKNRDTFGKMNSVFVVQDYIGSSPEWRKVTLKFSMD